MARPAARIAMARLADGPLESAAMRQICLILSMAAFTPGIALGEEAPVHRSAVERFVVPIAGRVRMVEEGPDGAIYFGSDGGGISRLVPAPH